jgi:hypothetical protein
MESYITRLHPKESSPDWTRGKVWQLLSPMPIFPVSSHIRLLDIWQFFIRLAARCCTPHHLASCQPHVNARCWREWSIISDCVRLWSDIMSSTMSDIRTGLSAQARIPPSQTPMAVNLRPVVSSSPDWLAFIIWIEGFGNDFGIGAIQHSCVRTNRTVDQAPVCRRSVPNVAPGNNKVLVQHCFFTPLYFFFPSSFLYYFVY